ncbi:MFS transporter [Candidatus Nitrospira bockiana]
MAATTEKSAGLAALPRNVWAAGAASFFMDISSEMILNVLPLFLANVLGVKTAVIGLIEGVAEATASLLKVVSGQLSDRWRTRKWPAVAGYALSAFSKPGFYFASSWGLVAGVRWIDRLGKGIRTAPRDALVAASVAAEQRGLAFGFQRAADTAGATTGVLVALGLVWWAQATQVELGEPAFRLLVVMSLVPAALAVAVLAWGARDVPAAGGESSLHLGFRGLGRPFTLFMLIVGVFELGNSSDAFLVLRAQERGVSVVGILALLAMFNLVYALVATPAGHLSDRLGRRRMILAGWLLYAAVYAGFAVIEDPGHVWVLYLLYGAYYGLTYGTAKALIADLVPEPLRGTAYGTHSAVVGILDLPASVIAGVLWQGVGTWPGFGPSAPFVFGAGMALLAAGLLALQFPPAGNHAARHAIPSGVASRTTHLR